MPTAVVVEGSEFTPIEPADLGGDICVLAQAVDNQWVPSNLLSRMTSKGLSLDAVRDEYEQMARSEYLRALINSERVIINRAYIHNTPAVYSDFIPSARTADREAFKYLLQQGSIIPSLFREEFPHQPPSYTVGADVLNAWRDVCLSTHMQCLRLAWDADANSKLANQLLARRFNEFVTSFSNFDATSLDSLAADMDLATGSANALKQHFRNVARFKLDHQDTNDRLPNREDYYRKFVTAPGTEPRAGVYDGSKPFSACFKQLLDLAYNVAGADALGQYTLSPTDSLSRTVLQELSFPQAGGLTEMDPKKLADLARRFAFEITQQAITMKSLHLLTMTDVMEIRRTEAWGCYNSLFKKFLARDDLLDHPDVFYDAQNGAPAIVKIYQKLAEVISVRMAANVAGGLADTWQPVCETRIEAPGASATLKLSLGIVSLEVKGSISDLWNKAVPLAYRFGIRPAKGYATRLSTLVNIKQMKMTQPRKQWEELLSRLRSIPGIQEAPQSADLREAVTEKA